MTSVAQNQSVLPSASFSVPISANTANTIIHNKTFRPVKLYLPNSDEFVIIPVSSPPVILVNDNGMSDNDSRIIQNLPTTNETICIVTQPVALEARRQGYTNVVFAAGEVREGNAIVGYRHLFLPPLMPYLQSKAISVNELQAFAPSTTLVNCTPHSIHLFETKDDTTPLVLLPSGNIPRVEETPEHLVDTIKIGGVEFPVYLVAYNDVLDLPQETPGRMLVVSRLTRDVAWLAGRRDVYSPGNQLLDDNNKIRGTIGLSMPLDTSVSDQGR